ncbi:hypothetical protein R3P38DRAFT_2768715 [Favolaschia claudopus]|uniref:Uncharacterized protein n=1 Tax=Favolaschia claudopus TaxID=2862362 RepID=A0AAW0CQZ5_9AGAR
MNTTPKQKLVQYRSMNCLLETLGLSNTNPKVPQELQASIYTKLSYDIVLRACNWSGQTFINKTRLYSAVNLSTERSWKGNPPGQNDTDFDIYQIWLSAKYFWSVEALNIETEPNPDSSNEVLKRPHLLFTREIMGENQDCEVSEYIHRSDIDSSILCREPSAFMA